MNEHKKVKSNQGSQPKPWHADPTKTLGTMNTVSEVEARGPRPQNNQGEKQQE